MTLKRFRMVYKPPQIPLALRTKFAITPFGGVVLIVALIILIRSLVTRNSYEIVLASGILFLLLLIGIVGFWKSCKLKSMEAAWKPPFPMTAQTLFGQTETGEEQYQYTQVTGLDAAVPLFFRLHFSVRGRFFPGGLTANNLFENSLFENSGSVSASAKNSCSVLVETSVPRGETSAWLLLGFPISGIFNGESFCRLRDIFGFFSFNCGVPLRRTIKVRSAPCFGKKIHINAQSGAEDRRNKQSIDVERYYMREYTPGDRLRDINWKSSDRIDTLITRISTDNREKISRIKVYFRNYGSSFAMSENALLEELWLLDRAKARLAYFLRSLQEQNSSFVFDVSTARESREIENQDDLDTFLEDLAGISFAPPQNEAITDDPQKTGEIYVFSTACDSGLPAFLLSCNPGTVTLFITQPADHNVTQKPAVRGTEPEILCVSDFTQKGCTPSLQWFRRGVKPLGVNIGRMEVNYAQTMFDASFMRRAKPAEKQAEIVL